MNEEHKKNLHEKYKIALQKGERFWPDSIYKDLIMAFAIFMVLILLATFIGVPGEPKADPSDSAYVPKPEWYFLFLFKFLALYGQIPGLGKIEWIATVLIPGAAILLLFVLPLTDKNPYRYYSRRVLAITVMGVFVVGMVVLTMIANIPTSSAGGMDLSTVLQFLAGLVIPTLAYIAIIVLGFMARKKAPQTGHAQIWIAVAASIAMLVLGVIVMVTAPKAETAAEVTVANTVTEKIIAGQDLYSINCTECHGEDGKVTEITGVEGLEGKQIMPINSTDVMYTLNDQALADIVSYGRPDSGMTPFGRTYGGELSPSDIDYLVTYMRYSWDNRVEMPAGAVSTIPELQPGEVPSWDVHISALTKRYCVSCHRSGKTNNNYLMTSYEEMLTTGDNAPVMTAGDPDSLLLQLINGQEYLDPKTNKTIRQMPVNKLLNQKYIDMLTLWIMNGMPQTAEDAAALSTLPTPTPTP